jgi:hypothetical protein
VHDVVVRKKASSTESALVSASSLVNLSELLLVARSPTFFTWVPCYE